ncbi:MAG TPA: bifunctional nicotinamidase/pyrazinamidase [Terrimicrobium sp.]
MSIDALILVDIQNDFVPGGALAVPKGDQIVPLANRLQQCFELIVATQDWHPATHGSFAINHAGRNPGDVIDLNGLPQILWPGHCVQDTPGADFVPALDRTRWSRVFPKGTRPEIDSYSGFFDNGRRNATGLGDYLQERDVTNLYLLGLATDYCIKFSALDARHLGFKTLLIEDASRGVDLKPGDVARAIEEMKDAGVEVVTSASVAARKR